MSDGTAKRWQDRKASAHIFPTIPAEGHMPFKGHAHLPRLHRANPYKPEPKPRLSKRLAEYGFGL